MEATHPCQRPEELSPDNIYELGLIYKIDIGDEGNVAIDMTLTFPAYPAAELQLGMF